ncbi:MAG: arylsulfatase A-like enzyme [Planctomycetota bacterium]|jgi:arylsulfatase A-like enzyme
MRPNLPTFLLLGTILSLTGCTPEPQAERPNVLLISIDTLRADHLSCYGYERATSPNIDALADEGFLFERALSTSSWTLPAHLSLFTGLPVSAHGVCDDRLWTRHDSAGQPISAPLRGRFLSDELNEAGYRNAGFYSWKYLDEQFGFGSGFEDWERFGHSLFSHPVTGREFERLRAANDIDALKALAAAHPELPTEDGVPCSDKVVDRALAWLDGVEESDDFFLFVHLFDVHDPYVPPEPFDRKFDADYQGPIDGRRVTTADSSIRGDMPAADLQHLIALYDGGISWVDSQVGRLIEGLRAKGLDENTLIILTSDHGEEFFEHGHKTHRRQLFLESIQVPLIIRWPAKYTQPKRIPGTVGIVDVAATIYAAAGIETNVPTAGEDLIELAQRETPRGTRTYLSEMQLFAGSAVPERQLALAKDDDFAFLQATGGAAWHIREFDLSTDPRGAQVGSVVTTDADSRRPWRSELDRMRRFVSQLRDAQPTLAGALPALDEHDKKQLAALGYAGLEDADFGEGDENRLCLDGCVWPNE